MLRNLAQKIKSLMLLAAQSVTADINSASADLQKYRSFAFLVSVGTFAFSGVNKIALKMQESDDNTTFTDCALEAYSGGAIKELAAATDDDTVHVVEYKGHKRYVRMTLDVSGTVAAPIAVVGLSADLTEQPLA
jgi:hypothetical protein